MNYDLEELTRTLFEESSDAVVLFDPETEQTLEVNPAAQRLTGFTRQQLLRLPASYLFRSERAGGMRRLRQAFRKTGAFHSQEGFFLRNQQDGVWVAVNVTITRLHTHARTLGLITARDIREQRAAYLQLQQSEAALRTSEERYRAFLAHSSEAIWRFELEQPVPTDLPEDEQIERFFRDGYIAECNDATARMYGFSSAAELVGARLHALLVPTDERNRAGLRAFIRAGYRLVDAESHEKDRHGNSRYFLNNYVGIVENGALVRAWGTQRDVTERRQAEQALRESEDRYRDLFENANDLIYTLDLRGCFTSLNHRAAELLGCGRQTLLGHDAVEVVFPEYHELMRSQLQRKLEGWEGPTVYELEVRDRDGARRALEVSSRLIAKDGQPLGVQGIARDISERKRVDEAIRASEAKYRSLVENLEQAIFLKDTAFRFVAVNRPFCASLGRPEEDIIGRDDFAFFPPELATKFRADDEAVLREGKRLEVEEQALVGGKPRTARTVKTPVQDGQGRTVGVLGIFWDVTQQRTLEAQARQAQKMEAVGQLAGGIAHDFNNLLTAVLGNLSLLTANLAKTDPNRELVAAAEQAALRAATLTSQLLGFSRQARLNPAPTDLRATIDEVVTILRRTIDPRITLEVRTAAGLWPILADPAQMNQVLLNLCLNSRDAMPEGGRLLLEAENCTLEAAAARLHVEARPGEFVCLRVGDTGHGIAPEIRPRIFEPFFTTKGPGKGTGLGLAMVFGIVQQHQGWIDCHSELGQGTRFDIYLPRSTQELPVAEQAVLPGTALRGSETILLVDDEPMLRNLGRTILQRYGYEVLLAEDGAQAIDVYRRDRGRIHLVILDMTMPRLSGRDAFRQLRQIDPDVRVLFASGYSAETVTDAENDLILGFVSKPYRPEDLAGTIRAALDKAAVRTSKQMNYQV